MYIRKVIDRSIGCVFEFNREPWALVEPLRQAIIGPHASRGHKIQYRAKSSTADDVKIYLLAQLAEVLEVSVALKIENSQRVCIEDRSEAQNRICFRWCAFVQPCINS